MKSVNGHKFFYPEKNHDTILSWCASSWCKIGSGVEKSAYPATNHDTGELLVIKKFNRGYTFREDYWKREIDINRIA